MSDAAKETVIIVHGTWAAPEPSMTRWYERAAEGAAENFVGKLDAALQERGSPARCWAHSNDHSSIFYWSHGENSWIVRTHAASALTGYLTNLRNDGWRCHIVAHSHGGNVVVEALPQILTSRIVGERLGKIVTLGTPFIDTMSPIRKRSELSRNRLRKIGWGMIFYYLLSVVVVPWFLIPRPVAAATTALVTIVALFVWRVLRKKGAVQDVAQTARQLPETLLAISCPTDEAWQILHHLPKIANPLAVQSNLLWYLISSVQSQASRLRAVSRIRGARTFRDVSLVAKCVLGLLYLVLFFGIVLAFGRFQGDETMNSRQILLLSLDNVMGAFIIALLVLPIFGADFYSAFLSPFRWVAQRIQSLTTIGPTFGTYLVRRWSWPVLLRMTMGLEGHRFSPPPVTQCPTGIPHGFAKYENMPDSAEQRALEKRTAWIARHLGDASKTFSSLAVTATDITSLLRTIEADQTLVHAAYYTDDECIVRIADWIAGRG